MPIEASDHRAFFEHYATAMEDGTAAVFVGAGLSREAGFVDWKELLADIADDLNLEIDRESDLVSLAQYHVNHRNSRAAIDRKLIAEFMRDAEPTEAHRLLARLPIATVWTTNYDGLLERAYRDAGVRPDVRSGPNDIARAPLPKRGVVIYKMHGDRDHPDEAVLLKEDYEVYESERGEYTRVLRSDFLQRTFLFLGFSFTDPNIDQVLARLRDRRRPPGDHYWVVREVPEASADATPTQRAEAEYERRKQNLKIRDLERYGIRAIRVREYSDVN
ncbi:MAG TPA: SIR2 family protein, partial [Longimicrobium sp.]